MYTKLPFDSLNTKSQRTFSDTVTNLLSTEYKIGPSGKLIGKDPQGGRNIPWVFIHHEMRKKFCSFWNNVCTMRFNLIPTPCRMSCWKTVIKPRNVLELFSVYETMIALNLPSKIGMDLRKYTYGPWAGFIYADTLQEGQKYTKMIVDAVKPKRVPIILKRGCTEMERLIPSDQWNKISEKDIELERRLCDLFDFSEPYFAQAAWLKTEIKEQWIKRAIEIGDPTAQEAAEKYSDDPDIWNKLVVHSVTYHDKKE
jgi:hypothetical protein